MARYRLSDLAKTDISSILRTSETRHGTEARIRYRGLLSTALRRIAEDPQRNSSVDRRKLFSGLRSLHIRYSRAESREAPVGDPVHVIFYRTIKPGLVEIVRVLHEKMEPSLHMGATLDQNT